MLPKFYASFELSHTLSVALMMKSCKNSPFSFAMCICVSISNESKPSEWIFTKCVVYNV